MDHEEVKERLRRKNPGAIVQSMRSHPKDNVRLIEMMAAQTFAAMESGQLLANKPEMDLLLRAAGTAQITQAVAEEGARKGRPFVVAVAVRKGLVRGLEGLGRKVQSRKLSEGELDAVERAALLNVLKA